MSREQPASDAYVEVAACDLSEQDFDLPCSITREGEPCSRPAEWWAQFKPHHNSTGSFDNLLCPNHYEYVTSGGAGACRKCGEPVVFKDYLVRIERIKP